MTARSEHEFDLAVSFAGEDRSLVEGFVDAVKSAGLRVFLDRDHQVEMWGADLIEYFDEIYRTKSRYAVIFASHHYARKMWTRHERRSALARGLEQAEPYVLPIRLDDVQLPGLRPSVGYLDARRVGLAGLVDAALAKCGSAAAAPIRRVDAVPDTEDQMQQLLLSRPAGWEWLAFVGWLRLGRDGHDAEYRDHILGFSPLPAEPLAGGEVFLLISRQMNAARALIAALMRLISTEAQEYALGAEGEPGDADRIRHLANRWTDTYAAMISWAASVRAAAPPDAYRALLHAVSRMLDDAIEKYRVFVDDMSNDLIGITTRLEAGETVNLSRTLVIDIPRSVSNDVEGEFEALKRQGLA